MVRITHRDWAPRKKTAVTNFPLKISAMDWRFITIICPLYQLLLAATSFHYSLPQYFSNKQIWSAASQLFVMYHNLQVFTFIIQGP